MLNPIEPSVDWLNFRNHTIMANPKQREQVDTGNLVNHMPIYFPKACALPSVGNDTTPGSMQFRNLFLSGETWTGSVSLECKRQLCREISEHRIETFGQIVNAGASYVVNPFSVY